MYDSLVLFYVGVLLILNGLSMFKFIEDRDVLIINALVGFLFLRIANELAFGKDSSIESVSQATLSLMFAFTYLWIAYNKWTGSDGRGLGWFSAIVSVTALLVSIKLYAVSGNNSWKLWDAASWTAWALLWGLFFLHQVVKLPLVRLIASMSIAQGLLTGWLPALLLIKV